MGVLDFAGSGPVHIASGFAALAWSLMLGARKDHNGESIHNKMPQFRPHNPFLVGLGTILIWFGWFAFNGIFLPPRYFVHAVLILDFQVHPLQISPSEVFTSLSTPTLPRAEVASPGSHSTISLSASSAFSVSALASFPAS